jgi:hypothetical protein
VGGDRCSTVTNTSRFSYDAPELLYSQPNPFSALGGPIGIAGLNFGLVATSATISIDGQPCDGAAWVNDNTLSCTSPPLAVGPKNVSVLVANRTTPSLAFDFQRSIMAECPTGYTGLNGEVCIACPVGALCPGYESAVSLTSALPGFWKMEVNFQSCLTRLVCY